MKFIAIIFFILISLVWCYISWEYFKNINEEINQSIKNTISAILITGQFILGFLLSKLIYNNRSNLNSKITSNKEIDKEYEKDFFLPEIVKIKETIYKNYSTDSKSTKNSINTILYEKKKVKKIQKKEQIIDHTFLNVSNNIKKKNKQDLKIIEGIGPKIEELLNKGGIYSYKDLELSDISDLKNILENAGSRYMLHNPTTWPKQAQIANSGKFDELKKYQDKLIKGIEK